MQPTQISRQRRPGLIDDVRRPAVPPYRYNYAYSSRKPAVTITTRPAVSATRPTVAPVPKRRGLLSKMIITSGIVLIIGGMVAGGMHVVHAGNAANSTSSSDVTNTQPAAKTQTKLQTRYWQPAAVSDPALAKAINGIIAQYPDLEIGVNLVSVADGQTAHYGVSDPYVAASVDKLLTASAYLHQVDTGKLSLTQKLEDGNTAQTDLQNLIVNSDNNAWTALDDFLTRAQLKVYATSLGLNSYDANANIIAPEDIAQLLYKLYTGKLLNAATQEQLLSYMQQANYSQYIMAAIPSGVTAYHKSGVLNDRLNDVAIIDNGKTAYVLVIFSKAATGDYDFSQGQKLFHDLTTTTTSRLL